MHPSLTLILGGARSGKSRRAEALIEALPGPWTYIATAEAFDDEMRDRIDHHRARRDARWTNLDAPRDLAAMMVSIAPDTPVLLDCLTLWLTNVMLADLDVSAECRSLVDVLTRPTGPWVVVSNEVGYGIVPDNALARRFRDEQGRLNQMVASVATRVELVVAGIPMVVKDARL
jgi:adenosylcobinamide kinase / adenosylcobinamide-phosphate guanylyltransferase